MRSEGLNPSRVLLLGAAGSIGSRYAAILKGIRGVEYTPMDPLLEDPPHEDVYQFATHAIIATPTNTHIPLVKKCMEYFLPILCEKPLSKDVELCREVEEYDRGFVVNNYQYVVHTITHDRPSITYDYYRTGRDGLKWDACQLYYLDPAALVRTRSPIWTMTVNEVRISYRLLEESYVWMIKDFLANRRDRLWTFLDGRKMTERVLKRPDNGSTNVSV